MKNISFDEHPLDTSLKLAMNGEFEKSENILNSLDLNDPRIMFNLGWHRIRKGDLLGGFEYLNAGRFINSFGLPPIKGKIWKNEDLNKKTLLFRCEGGFGDQIMNIRFVKEFKKKGANVVISCDKELFGLFSKNDMICVDNSFAEKVHYDFWVPGMSAVYTLGHTFESLDGSPYLNSNHRKLYSKPNTLKVGIRWSGNPEFEHEQHRRFNPNLMIDLHEIEGTTMYSLQRDENLIYGLPFYDLKNDMVTWEDTSEILKGLDLVITSCTSIAHLSAALGVETWVVVPVLPYYCWSLPGDKSPWYDSVKIFRQEKYGDWDFPFKQIKDKLIEKIGARI